MGRMHTPVGEKHLKTVCDGSSNLKVRRQLLNFLLDNLTFLFYYSTMSETINKSLLATLRHEIEQLEKIIDEYLEEALEDQEDNASSVNKALHYTKKLLAMREIESRIKKLQKTPKI